MNDERGERAAARGRAAAQRAAELKALREQLVQGDPVTEHDVWNARSAAAASRERDVESTLAAAEGHRAAARAHRRAAKALERAGNHEKAAWHREQADVDDAGARDDDSTAWREARQ